MALTTMDVNRAPAVTGNFLALAANPIVAVALKVFAASATMEFINDGQTLLFFDNQAAGTSVIGFTIPNISKDGVTFAAASQVSFSLAADSLSVFGPFPPSTYNDTAGKVQVLVGTLTTLFAFVQSINK